MEKNVCKLICYQAGFPFVFSLLLCSFFFFPFSQCFSLCFSLYLFLFIFISSLSHSVSFFFKVHTETDLTREMTPWTKNDDASWSMEPPTHLHLSAPSPPHPTHPPTSLSPPPPPPPPPLTLSSFSPLSSPSRFRRDW